MVSSRVASALRVNGIVVIGLVLLLIVGCGPPG
jgi:hypothetical protein